VPSNALAQFPYQLSVSVVSQTDSKIRDKVTVTVNILPHSRLKIIGPPLGKKGNVGQSISYTFTVINMGNTKDKIRIFASSAHKEKVDLSKDEIDLDIGGQEEIVVTVHIPLDVSTGTSHVLTVRAMSILFKEGISDQTIVSTPIQEARGVKREGFYKTLPSQIGFYLSGFGTGNPIGSQVDFYTGGYLDDRHWMNFRYQGPYYKNKENYRGFSEEKNTFNAGGEVWDISLGDTTVSLSELTVSSLSEEGVKLGLRTDKVNAMYFNLEEKGRSFKEDLSGGKIAAKIGNNTQVGVNYFQSDEDQIDLSATRTAEEKEILSLSTQYKLNNFVLLGEYGGGHFNDGTGEKEDSAWWVNSRLAKEQLYINSDYIHAGSNYPGRRKDIDGYRSYLSYRFFKQLWLWIYKNVYGNNLNKDPGRSTEDTDRVAIGTSFSKKQLPYLSLSYAINKSKAEQQQALTSDSEEDVVLFRSSQTFGRLSVSFESQWSKTQDAVTYVDSKTSQYTTRIYRRWEKFSGWVDYSYNIEDNKTVIREGFGGVYQPMHEVYASLSFSQEGAKNEKDSEILSFDVNYNPIEDMYFSLEGEMRNNHEDVKDEWRLWFSFRKSFDLLIPFIKIRGSVDGVVFIDENNNGVFDKDEEGISAVSLLLEQNKAITDKKGKFRFASVIPGEYGLDIEISSVPVGLVSRIELPHKIDVPKGKLEEVNIPMVKVCKAKGIVFEDKNKDGKRDEGEKGIALVRILLITEGMIQRDTFSDAEGNYSFSGLLPGKYNISIDEDWLPARHKLTTHATHIVDLAPHEELTDLNFGSVEKEKKIIKTYSAPEVETIYPEEKKKAQERKWWQR
jgi:hypothetical protein